MFILSMVAFAMCGLVLAKGVLFCAHGNQFREDDRAEVGMIMAGSFVFVIVHLSLWVLEPWKVTNNSLSSSGVMAFCVYTSGYFYHRLRSLMDGRDRRNRPRGKDRRQAERRAYEAHP